MVTQATYNQLDERTRQNHVANGDGTYTEDPLMLLYNDEEEQVSVRLSEATGFDWEGRENGSSVYGTSWVDVVTQSQTYTYWFNSEDLPEDDVTGDIIISAIEAW